MTVHHTILGILCTLLFNIGLFLQRLSKYLHSPDIFIIFIAMDFITILNFPSLFNCSLIVEHLGCFQLCAITNKAINIFVQLGLKIIFFSKFPKVGILAQRA